MGKENLFEKISDAVVEMDSEETIKLCQESLDENIPAYETINDGLIKGMDRISKLYDEEEYYIPELLLCSDALNAGLDMLSPHLDTDNIEQPLKIVLGVVEGDTHDIGKNLVHVMMESSGFEVYDLGRDVPIHQFVEKAEEVNADIIGMSTLMTTTMNGMEKVIKELEEKNIRNKYKVLIGGGPISQKYADAIGADLYTSDANKAVKKVKELFNKEA